MTTKTHFTANQVFSDHVSQGPKRAMSRFTAIKYAIHCRVERYLSMTSLNTGVSCRGPFCRCSHSKNKNNFCLCIPLIYKTTFLSGWKPAHFPLSTFHFLFIHLWAANHSTCRRLWPVYSPGTLTVQCCLNMSHKQPDTEKQLEKKALKLILSSKRHFKFGKNPG